MPQPTTPPTTFVLDETVLGLVISVVSTAAIALVGACVLTWLALRGTRPQDRPAVLDATARLITALATLLRRSRRR